MSLPENARFTVKRFTGRVGTCPHVADIRDDVQPDSTAGCPDCLAVGDTWVHLRMCMTCGHVGCCDSSKNKHASAHASTTGHPVIRSLEPGETWLWCMVDQQMVERA